MKVLVSVTVPAISKQYDVLLPCVLTVREATRMIVAAVTELSNNRYTSSEHEFLCLPEKDMLLKEEEVLSSYGIKNGDHFVLV